jgi:hypothetical protein
VAGFTPSVLFGLQPLNLQHMLVQLENVPRFYKNYVKQVEETDIIEALRISGERMMQVLASVTEAQQDYRYAEGKWSIRELLCHMIDAERIFAYRALRFARNDNTPLPGWEENDYAPEANAESRSLAQITGEMQRLRLSTIDLKVSARRCWGARA